MKFLFSINNAINGIVACFLSEINFRIHVVAIICITIVAICFRISTKEWIMVSFCAALVIVTEMINTAIEKTCDLITKENNDQIKFIKDVSAGAVLISAALSMIIGALVFLPKILNY